MLSFRLFTIVLTVGILQGCMWSPDSYTFEWLDAPIRRIGGLDTPVPFSPTLEDAYRPNAEKIYAVARDLAAF